MGKPNNSVFQHQSDVKFSKVKSLPVSSFAVVQAYCSARKGNDMSRRLLLQGFSFTKESILKKG